MRKTLNVIIIVISVTFLAFQGCITKSGDLVILESTDLHGVILPYDLITKRELKESMAGTAGYIRKIRKEGENPILLDNGDNLQGQPSVYYYNFIDTLSPHLMALAFNLLGFDASTIGNHDIEAGHSVYDRLSDSYDFPLLAANAVDTKTGNPYFTPYIIIERDGIKVAILGLVTPAIPEWLPEKLYSGIRFRDMVETAREWMPEILKNKPDIVVGLFHSGWDKNDTSLTSNGTYRENGVAAVAYNIPGFDIIFCGHDHRAANEKMANVNGDSVLILNGGSHSRFLARADLNLTKNRLSGKTRKTVTGSLVSISDYDPDSVFISNFEEQDKILKNYVGRVLGECKTTFSSRDSYFGSSAFIDLIHRIQLEMTGADVSFTAPLSFDAQISAGPVTVSDMFKIYRFENLLYTMSMSGKEIKDYLEYSYAGWINTIRSPDDHLLKFRTGADGKPLLNNGRAYLRNQPYNFDSAAGIDYEVDATKPEGNRIKIQGFSNGRPFNLDVVYSVALNSYRGNGGGGHLTEGAGIAKNDLASRIIKSTDRDLRYYIMSSIEKTGEINPAPLNNWKMVPEKIVRTASHKDRTLLFGYE